MRLVTLFVLCLRTCLALFRNDRHHTYHDACLDLRRPVRVACVGDSITFGNGSRVQGHDGRLVTDKVLLRGNYPSELGAHMNRIGKTYALPSFLWHVRCCVLADKTERPHSTNMLFIHPLQPPLPPPPPSMSVMMSHPPTLTCRQLLQIVSLLPSRGSSNIFTVRSLWSPDV